VVLCPQKAYRCVRLNVYVKLSASIQRFTQRARCKAGVKGQGGILKKSYRHIVRFFRKNGERSRSTQVIGKLTFSYGRSVKKGAASTDISSTAVQKMAEAMTATAPVQENCVGSFKDRLLVPKVAQGFSG
jgi:hypothetical protein